MRPRFEFVAILVVSVTSILNSFKASLKLLPSFVPSTTTTTTTFVVPPPPTTTSNASDTVTSVTSTAPGQQPQQAARLRRTTDDDTANDETTTTTTTTTLWIVTCETRTIHDIKPFELMWKSATAFQTLNNGKNSASSSSFSFHVEIKNVCHNVQWNGYMTKMAAMVRFTSQLLLSRRLEKATMTASNKEEGEQQEQPPLEPRLLSYLATSFNSSEWVNDRADEINDLRVSLQEDARNDNNGIGENDYVMFVDSDVVVNTWSTTAVEDLLATFDRIREGRSIVMGGEPACYIGTKCNAKDFHQFYPEFATPNHPGTSCPNYVNSGMYMGKLPDVWNMMVDLMQLEHQLEGTDTPLSTLLIKPDDDQGRATVWYSQNRDKIILDTTAAIFRNLMFGQVNHYLNTYGKYTCGLDLHCKMYKDSPYQGRWNEKRFDFVFDEAVPSCLTAEHPFIVHGNGSTKGRFALMSAQFWKLFDDMEAMCKARPKKRQGALCQGILLGSNKNTNLE